MGCLSYHHLCPPAADTAKHACRILHTSSRTCSKLRRSSSWSTSGGYGGGSQSSNRSPSVASTLRPGTGLDRSCHIPQPCSPVVVSFAAHIIDFGSCCSNFVGGYCPLRPLYRLWPGLHCRASLQHWQQLQQESQVEARTPLSEGQLPCLKQLLGCMFPACTLLPPLDLLRQPIGSI